MIIINILLIHKYNIFNGDDGVLIPHIADYYFFHFKDSIICKEWPIHKFYLQLLSDSYLYYFNFSTAFGFSSEIKSLLEIINKEKIKDINYESIYYHLKHLWCPTDNTIFKNIPKDTEISIGDTYYGILSEVENLEISLDTNDIYIIKMNNSSYNLSSQTFKLTAYEN